MSIEQSTRSGQSAPDRSERAKGPAKAGRPYSDKLRFRVLTAVEGGASYREAAAQHGVSASAIVKWAKRFRQTGSVAAKPMGGDRRSRLKGERDWLLRRMAADPELTLADLHQELCARGIQVGYLTVKRFIKKETSGRPQRALSARMIGKARAPR
jgi:transposase